MCSPCMRRDKDITKLMMNGFKVEPIENSTNKFLVEFKGPQDSLYQDGVWMVRVEVPSDYPYKSPSISFSNKIYHPNIDAIVGSICVDVLEQNWYPTYDLLNVFEIFLPQLLLYPNPEDPLNGEAGALMLQDREAYDQKVKEYCLRYAKAGNLGGKQDEEGSKQEDEGGENTVDTSDEGGEDSSDEGGEGIWIFIENRN